ncbi:hypothetical protein LTR84_000861 [Exophiala bonariae]|uniref:AB hydrolase-1 domain-containing protein n=1 Tax=Exophiala bonariae TaxID=1690606 RepID=A0AAV9NST3_9EURO|nr:hypothetical protein LTR84_000861 [Exophiala bonariae]
MAIIVLVPGSFAPADLYTDFVEVIAKAGLETVVVDTPSVGRREGKGPATMTDDANEISRVVSPLIDQGKEVVLVAHSYGGIPTTQSLERLSPKARGAQGKSGGVLKVIYLTAVVLQVGMSNFELFGGTMPDFVSVADDYMSLSVEANAPLTFSDLPEDKALMWANRMSVHSTLSFKEKLTYPGYNDVQVHYILCEEDKIIPPQFQQAMIDLIKASSGNEVQVHSINSGHCPTHSQPDNLVNILKKIVQG